MDAQLHSNESLYDYNFMPKHLPAVTSSPPLHADTAAVISTIVRVAIIPRVVDALLPALALNIPIPSTESCCYANPGHVTSHATTVALRVIDANLVFGAWHRLHPHAAARLVRPGGPGGCCCGHRRLRCRLATTDSGAVLATGACGVGTHTGLTGWAGRDFEAAWPVVPRDHSRREEGEKSIAENARDEHRGCLGRGIFAGSPV